MWYKCGMTYLLKNAQLLYAEHNHATLDVLIDGTTIAAVGTDLSSVDQVIDLSGYTILPGFVDAHVHVAVDDRAFKEDAVRAWAYNGVTTVRELGMLSTLSQQDYAQWIRKNNQKSDTAHVVATGKYIDVAGGYGAGPMPNHPVGNLITNPAEAADAVTLAHNLGYPGIKIGIHDGSMEQTPHLAQRFVPVAVIRLAHENLVPSLLAFVVRFLLFSCFSFSQARGFSTLVSVQTSCPGSFCFSFSGNVASNCANPSGSRSQTKYPSGSL